jgi:hypothetical protein
MYPEVAYPSRLLYSIYTGREAQCNTTNNHTQYIILTDCMAALQQFYDMSQQDLHFLNQALVVMIPKKPNAESL